MKEYEIIVESMTACGGSKYAKREFREVRAESPEAYVGANGVFPILNIGKNQEGDIVITTGDGRGNVVRFTFNEGGFL